MALGAHDPFGIEPRRERRHSSGVLEQAGGDEVRRKEMGSSGRQRAGGRRGSQGASEAACREGQIGSMGRIDGMHWLGEGIEEDRARRSRGGFEVAACRRMDGPSRLNFRVAHLYTLLD